MGRWSSPHRIGSAHADTSIKQALIATLVATLAPSNIVRAACRCSFALAQLAARTMLEYFLRRTDLLRRSVIERRLELEAQDCALGVGEIFVRVEPLAHEACA